MTSGHRHGYTHVPLHLNYVWRVLAMLLLPVPAALAVKCQDVISVQVESGDGCGAADALMRSMPVVVV